MAVGAAVPISTVTHQIPRGIESARLPGHAVVEQLPPSGTQVCRKTCPTSMGGRGQGNIGASTVGDDGVLIVNSTSGPSGAEWQARRHGAPIARVAQRGCCSGTGCGDVAVPH